jgi:hypothetical protein
VVVVNFLRGLKSNSPSQFQGINFKKLIRRYKMTTLIRILAALTALLFYYSLFATEFWLDIRASNIAIFLFAIAMTVYALIGHKLAKEGNFFTEDVVKATKKDFKTMFNKDR